MTVNANSSLGERRDHSKQDTVGGDKEKHNISSQFTIKIRSLSGPNSSICTLQQFSIHARQEIKQKTRIP